VVTFLLYKIAAKLWMEVNVVMSDNVLYIILILFLTVPYAETMERPKKKKDSAVMEPKA